MSFDVEIPDAVIVPVVVLVNNGKNSWFVVVSLNTVEPAPVKPEPSPKNADAVIIPTVSIEPVEPIPTPVNPEPFPINADAVMIPDVLIDPVEPIPTPVNPKPFPINADAVIIPDAVILSQVKFVIVPEVPIILEVDAESISNIANVETPLIDIPIVDVLLTFKTVCNVGLPASPVRFDPSPKYVTIPLVAVIIPDEITTVPKVLIPVTLRLSNVEDPETVRFESAAPTTLMVAMVAIPVTLRSVVSTFETSISPALISTVARVAIPETFKSVEISTESLIST